MMSAVPKAQIAFLQRPATAEFTKRAQGEELRILARTRVR
jgi:hypothetical protein